MAKATSLDEFLERRSTSALKCVTCSTCDQGTLAEIERFVRRKQAGEIRASFQALYEWLVQEKGYPPGIGKLLNHVRGCVRERLRRQ